jgi:hypothetical protein
MSLFARTARRWTVALAGLAAAGVVAGLVISPAANAAPAPDTQGPSSSSLKDAAKHVQGAEQQLASAEQEVTQATAQVQQLSYVLVTLHTEQVQAKVALAAAREDARSAIRTAFDGATVDPTATLLADLNGHDPGLEEQVRDRRLRDVNVRTHGLAAANQRLAVVTKDVARRSVEATQAAARAVGAADRARTVLVAAEQNSTDLQRKAKLAAQRRALEKLQRQLAANLAAQAATQAVGKMVASSPADLITLYKGAATTCPGLPWGVLAAIGQVETGHGQNKNVSSAGAMGPMQFLPSTFAAYKVDGDGDGQANILDQADAVYSAANYLCANGGGNSETLYKAIWHYNHSDYYVKMVLGLAAQYMSGSFPG